MYRNMLFALGLLCPCILTGCNEGAGGHTEVTGAKMNSAGEYLSNPFTLRVEDQSAQLDIPETTFEFGRMAVKEERSHPFLIRNIGEVPVRLAMGESTCQCTIGKLETDELLPGEETEVTLTWKPEAHTPEFSKGARIWTDMPEMSYIDFKVKGQVVPEVHIMPSTTWSTGIIPDGQSAVLQGFAFSPLMDDFEITSIDPSHEWLKVDYSPMDPESMTGIDGLSGFKINCQVLQECPLGEFRGTLTLHTNIETDLHREITVIISGSKSGPFNITGRYWVSHGHMNLGEVSLDEGKTVELSLTAAPMGEPLVFELIESDPEFLGFEMRRDESFVAANRERYYLTFSIPPDVPLGEWVGESAGFVKLRTNIPGREEMTVRMEFSIRDTE